MLYSQSKAFLLYKGRSMKVEENIRLCKLFDAYGKLLSKGQQEVLSYYLNYDLTISEIASNLDVSRQAIKDSISKGEKKLESLEEKLGLLKRIEELEDKINQLSSKKED